MTLRLDPKDPTRTRVQYRNPNLMPGTPRILFVMDEPDKNGWQILVLNGGGSASLHQSNGCIFHGSKDPGDIINATPDAAELLEQVSSLLVDISDNARVSIEQAELIVGWLTKFQAWKAQND